MFVALRTYTIQEISILIKAVLSAVLNNRIKVTNFDGRELKIEKEVFISTREFWTPEKVPAVLIDVPSVVMDFTSIDRGFALLEGNRRKYIYLGDIDIELICYGRSVQERDTISDLICFFLVRKDIFEYLMKRGIRIKEPARVVGFGEETPVGQDFKFYFASVSMGLNTETTIEEVAGEYTIEDIVVEFGGILKDELRD